MDLLLSTNFFVKSLPISEEYFKSLNETLGEQTGVDYTDVLSLQDNKIEMFKIFNINNERILFTMDYLGCKMHQDFIGKRTLNDDLKCFEHE